MKVKVNLSLEQDTAETLKELAQFSHKTVSQWVTDKIWEEKDSRIFIAPHTSMKEATPSSWKDGNRGSTHFRKNRTGSRKRLGMRGFGQKKKKNGNLYQNRRSSLVASEDNGFD